MAAATNFYCPDVQLVRRNTVQKREKNYTGNVMCLKPNLARMRIEGRPAPGQKADPNEYEAYISTGKAVYQYDGLAKEVTEIKLAGGGVGLRVLTFGASLAEGGVPIVSGGKIVGGIGVSGVASHQDAQVAQAGAEALK